MKAIAHFKCLPIEHPDALVEIDIPEPVPGPRDLLVEVKAVSVNPVDTKVRQGYVLTCQCYPLTDRVVVSYDQ